MLIVLLAEGEEGHFMDPISRKTFKNSSNLVVMRQTGTVMLEETFNKIVKPEGHFEGEARTTSVLHFNPDLDVSD